jgi:hypothetical protein
MDMEWSLQNVVFHLKTRQWTLSGNKTNVLIYHCHSLLELDNVVLHNLNLSNSLHTVQWRRLKRTFLIRNYWGHRCANWVQPHFLWYSSTWSYLQTGTCTSDFLVVCNRAQWFWFLKYIATYWQNVHGMRNQTIILSMTWRIHTEIIIVLIKISRCKIYFTFIILTLKASFQWYV